MKTQPSTAGGRARLGGRALVGGLTGLGLLGCILCCTLPLLGVAGIAAGAAAWLASFERPAAGLLAVGLMASVLAVIRRHRNRREAHSQHGAACSADGGCGCSRVTRRLSGAARS
ncbi:MAG: hypothetical protein ABUS79_13905 [Pseudomonadota bacterium]